MGTTGTSKQTNDRQNVITSGLESPALYSAHLEDGGHPARPALAPALSTPSRRPSFIDEEEQPVTHASSSNNNLKEQPATWMSLPQKSQLAVLTLARLS